MKKKILSVLAGLIIGFNALACIVLPEVDTSTQVEVVTNTSAQTSTIEFTQNSKTSYVVLPTASVTGEVLNLSMPANIKVQFPVGIESAKLQYKKDNTWITIKENNNIINTIKPVSWFGLSSLNVTTSKLRVYFTDGVNEYYNDIQITINENRRPQ